jgi:hypothetical protein
MWNFRAHSCAPMGRTAPVHDEIRGRYGNGWGCVEDWPTCRRLKVTCPRGEKSLARSLSIRPLILGTGGPEDGFDAPRVAFVAGEFVNQPSRGMHGNPCGP